MHFLTFFHEQKIIKYLKIQGLDSFSFVNSIKILLYLNVSLELLLLMQNNPSYIIWR